VTGVESGDGVGLDAGGSLGWEVAAIWIVDPKSLAEGMRSDIVL